MFAPRRLLTAAVVATAMVSTGCRTDNAVKKDAKKAKNKIEKTIPGDSNDNGK